jgi:hypothetical protein
MKKLRYWLENIRETTPAPVIPSPEPTGPRRGSRENIKLGPNVIEFDMLENEACELFGNAVKGLQSAGSSFEIYQDYNLIWISIP